MKLTYLLNQRMPTEKAYGIQVANMCHAFASQGAEVELVVPSRNARSGSDIHGYYGVPRTFSVRRLGAPDFYFPGKLDQIAFHTKQFISGLLLIRRALKEKADIIYSRDEFLVYVLSFFSRKLALEVHKYSPKKRYFYRRFIKTKLPIVAISGGLRDAFVRNGFHLSQIHVAHDGVDIQEFNVRKTKEECRRDLNLPQEKKLIGYVGQLRTMGMDKGLDTLIAAFRSVQAGDHNTVLLIVGGVEKDIKEYRILAQQAGIPQEAIIFAGQQEHSRVPFYLCACDVLVIPYPNTEHYAHFMSPLKLFEYMASGRPIVVSNLPSIREVLDEHMAFIVKPDNPTAFAEGIKNALSSSDSPGIASTARKAAEGFTWESRAEKILSFTQRKTIVILTHDTDPRGGYGRYASDLGNGLTQKGYNIVFLKEREDGRPGIVCLRRRFGIVTSAWRARRYFRQADIIHALDVYPYGVIAWLGNILIGKPLVLSLQGTYSIAPFYHLKTRWLASRTLAAADRRIAISRFTKRAVEKATKMQNIDIINHGINLELFECERILSKKKFIISVGALKHRKGYHIAIQAFAAARKKVPDLEYIIVGNQRDTRYYQKLQDLVRECDVYNRVHFRVNVSDEELRTLYSQASLFLLPSVNQGNHVEGFGLVFLEAAAAGLPVIGTRENGIEDAIQEGSNGLLVEQHNIRDTAQAIMNIVGDAERWDTMSQASYAWARRHDLSYVIESYDRVYRQVI